MGLKTTAKNLSLGRGEKGTTTSDRVERFELPSLLGFFENSLSVISATGNHVVGDDSVLLLEQEQRNPPKTHWMLVSNVWLSRTTAAK